MKRRYLSFLTILVLFLALPVWGQGLPTVKPEKVGLSSERLERIGDIMQADIDAGRAVGTLAMIARHGKVAYFEGRGLADREAERPMTKDTIFRIYSMSKPITSTALMTLFEEGKFLLQEPVSKYLPELGGLPVAVDDVNEEGAAMFPDNLPEVDEDGNVILPEENENAIPAVPATRDMTIQDLLRHTAGLTYGVFANTQVDQAYVRSGILIANMTVEEMVGKLGKIPLLYQPGSRWHYSVSVDVQGRLIEVLSGMSFGQFLEERLFKPLGMVDTAFYVPEEKKDRFAQMYSPNEDGGLDAANAMLSRNYDAPPTFQSGGGGLVSTASDYMRFCQMHLNGGELDGVRILSRKTVELMSTDHLGGIPGGPGGFGLGFSVVMDLGQSGTLGSEGSFAWGGAAGTAFWIDPKEDLIGVYMIQNMPPRFPFGTIFKNLVYQAFDD